MATTLVDKITAGEAARLLGVSKPRLHQLLNQGLLPRAYFGRSLVFDRKAVELVKLRKDGRYGKRRPETG